MPSDLEDAAVLFLDAELDLANAHGADIVPATAFRNCALHDFRLAAGRGCDCDPDSCSGPILRGLHA